MLTTFARGREGREKGREGREKGEGRTRYSWRGGERGRVRRDHSSERQGYKNHSQLITNSTLNEIMPNPIAYWAHPAAVKSYNQLLE